MAVIYGALAVEKMRKHDYAGVVKTVRKGLQDFLNNPTSEKTNDARYLLLSKFGRLCVATNDPEIMGEMSTTVEVLYEKFANLLPAGWDGKAILELYLADFEALGAIRELCLHNCPIPLDSLIDLATKSNISSAKSRVTLLEKAGFLFLSEGTLHLGKKPKPPKVEAVSSVPTFKVYYAEKKNLNAKQRVFYNEFAESLTKRMPLDLKGQWSYGFVYLNEQFKSKKIDFEHLREVLLHFEANYPDSSLAEYSNEWRADTYFLENDWQSGWDVLSSRGVPLDIYMTLESIVKDSRINQQTAKKWQPKSMTITSQLNDKRDEIEQTLIQILDASHDELGHSFIVELWEKLLAKREAGDLAPALEEEFSGFLDQSELQDLLEYHDKNLYSLPRVAFKGSVRGSKFIEWPLPFKDTYWFNQIVRAKLQTLFRDAENIVRLGNDLPRVGEGWISEVSLFRSIQDFFPNHKVVHQGRPKWLGRQSLDIYFKNENIGIEYQGAQHSRPVSLFGGVEGFIRAQERDQRKRELCKSNGCHLIEVFPDYSLELVLAEIQEALNKK